MTGDGGWLGSYCLIMSASRSGDAVARLVVTRDARANVIVAGHPASEVRRRFCDDQTVTVLEIRWSDWSAKVIRER